MAGSTPSTRPPAPDFAWRERRGLLALVLRGTSSLASLALIAALARYLQPRVFADSQAAIVALVLAGTLADVGLSLATTRAVLQGDRDLIPQLLGVRLRALSIALVFAALATYLTTRSLSGLFMFLTYLPYSLADLGYTHIFAQVRASRGMLFELYWSPVENVVESLAGAAVVVATRDVYVAFATIVVVKSLGAIFLFLSARRRTAISLRSHRLHVAAVLPAIRDGLGTLAIGLAGSVFILLFLALSKDFLGDPKDTTWLLVALRVLSAGYLAAAQFIILPAYLRHATESPVRQPLRLSLAVFSLTMVVACLTMGLVSTRYLPSAAILGTALALVLLFTSWIWTNVLIHRQHIAHDVRWVAQLLSGAFAFVALLPLAAWRGGNTYFALGVAGSLLCNIAVAARVFRVLPHPVDHRLAPEAATPSPAAPLRPLTPQALRPSDTLSARASLSPNLSPARSLPPELPASARALSRAIKNARLHSSFASTLTTPSLPTQLGAQPNARYRLQEGPVRKSVPAPRRLWRLGLPSLMVFAILPLHLSGITLYPAEPILILSAVFALVTTHRVRHFDIAIALASFAALAATYLLGGRGGPEAQSVTVLRSAVDVAAAALLFSAAPRLASRLASALPAMGVLVAVLVIAEFVGVLRFHPDTVDAYVGNIPRIFGPLGPGPTSTVLLAATYLALRQHRRGQPLIAILGIAILAARSHYIALAILALFMAGRHFRTYARRYAIGGLLFLAFLFRYPAFRSRLLAIFSHDVTTQRTTLWRQALGHFTLVGMGPAGFVYRELSLPSGAQPVAVYTHNQYLTWITYFGLLGGLLGAALLWTTFKVAWKTSTLPFAVSLFAASIFGEFLWGPTPSLALGAAVFWLTIMAPTHPYSTRWNERPRKYAEPGPPTNSSPARTDLTSIRQPEKR